MDTKTFVALTRQAVAVSRRGTLRALGAAVVGAGMTAPAATHAAKPGKQGRKRCRRQRAQCRAYLETFCEPKADPTACEDAGFACCEHFARCDAGAGIACLFDGLLG
jgi:hypothetical protein